MSTTQEEANTIIIQQVANVQSQKALVADDTDIFMLLLCGLCESSRAA